MRSPTAPNLLFDLDPYYHPDAGAEKLRDEWLAFYRGHTHISYKTDLRLWFEWCALHAVTVLAARRADLEAFMRNMEDAGLKASTRQRRIAAVAGFYLHAEQEEVIARSPARFVRRPRVPDISTSAYLDRFELGRFLDQADRLGPSRSALCCLLALNGLRVGEAVGATCDALSFADGHHTLAIIRKGGKAAVVPLGPRTSRTVLAAAGERRAGPLLFDSYGDPMTRHTAGRAVRHATKKAGIDKRIGPHALRHTFISLGLDAGAPIREMQVAAGHAHVSTTIRYDRRAEKLDRHPTYLVSAYVVA